MTREIPAQLASRDAPTRACCDRALTPEMLRAFAQFNRGEYWAQHETLEALWRAETDPTIRNFYKGIFASRRRISSSTQGQLQWRHQSVGARHQLFETVRARMLWRGYRAVDRGGERGVLASAGQGETGDWRLG